MINENKFVHVIIRKLSCDFTANRARCSSYQNGFTFYRSKDICIIQLNFISL